MGITKDKVTTRLGIIGFIVVILYLLAPISLDFILIIGGVKKDFTFDYAYDYWIIGIGLFISFYLILAPDKILGLLGIGESILKSKAGVKDEKPE